MRSDAKKNLSGDRIIKSLIFKQDRHQKKDVKYGRGLKEIILPCNKVSIHSEVVVSNKVIS